MRNANSLYRYVAAMALSFVLLASAGANEAKEKILDQLVVALLSNDHAMFVADGTEEFQKALTKRKFKKVSDQFSHLTPEGYAAEYLTELYQRGVTVYLWKLTHKDSEEEMLARLILADDKVAGFWIE